MLVKTFYLFRKFICIFLVAFFSILLTFEANANILKDSLIKNLSFDSVKSLQTKLDKSSTDFILSQILNLLDHNSNKQAIKLINQIEYSTDFQNNLLFKANVLYYKSIALKSIGKLNESLQCNYVVLKIAENFKNHELMSKALNTMANVEANKGNYAKSIEYYFVSLKISENINDSLAIAKVYNNIALVYNAIKEYSKALSFLDNALKISVSMNNKKITASALNNIGLVYNDIGSFDKALQYFQYSLDIKKTLPDKRAIAFNLLTIGSVYELKNNYEQALFYFDKAKELNISIQNINGLVYTYLYSADVYYKLGHLENALSNYQYSYNLAFEIGDLQKLQETSEKISEIYNKYNKFDSAFYFIQKSELYKDSLKTENNVNQIVANYEKQQREEKIKLLLKDKELQNLNIEQKQIWIFILFIILILLIGLVFFILYNYKQKHKINKALLKNSINLEDRVNTETEINRNHDIMVTLKNRQALIGDLIGNISLKWQESLFEVENKINEIRFKTLSKDINEEYLKNSVENVTEKIQQMAMYIDDFKYFFKPEKEKNKFAISEVTDIISKYFAYNYSTRNIKIETTSNTEIFLIKGYKNEFTQVVLSLINLFSDNNNNQNIIFVLSPIKFEKNGGLIINIFGNNFDEEIIKQIQIEKPIFDINTKNINFYIINSIIQKRMNGSLSVNKTQSGVELKLEVPYE